MKKILVLGMLFFAFNIANAQTNVIKANPLGLIFGIANAGYEFATTDSQTATISGIYFNVSDVTGVGAGAEYRFYFAGEAIRGWHAGPSLGYLSLEDDFNNSASAFTIGGEIGHQWILRENFAIDVFAGVGAITGADSLSGFDATTAISLGFSFGYAW
jgi:hypothetical protein